MPQTLTFAFDLPDFIDQRSGPLVIAVVALLVAVAWFRFYFLPRWRARRPLLQPVPTPISAEERLLAVQSSADTGQVPAPRFAWNPSDEELLMLTVALQPTDPIWLGDWQVLGHLTQGGMGSIYLGRHHLTGEFAVLKVLRPEHRGFADFEARFEREATLVYQLPPHPNLPRFLEADVEFETPLPWIAMDYIPVPNLFQLMQQHNGQPLPDYLVAKIMADVLRAIIHLQVNGVEHRDIKPENVLFDPALEIAYVIDLGLALPRGGTRITRGDSFFGSPRYAPPERLFQSHGRDIHPSGDVWSVAAVGYFLASGGIPPFPGEGKKVPVSQIQTADVDYSLIGSINLVELLRYCFQANPDDRPTPELLLALLEGF